MLNGDKIILRSGLALKIPEQFVNYFHFKAALAFFYCAYYLRIFSSMFCGEITTNRRRLYRFRVFRIADLKTSQTKRFRVNLQNIATKRTILLEISYLIIAQTLVKWAVLKWALLTLWGMFTSTASTTSTLKANKVASKDSYYTCSRQLRMTCAADDNWRLQNNRCFNILAYQLHGCTICREMLPALWK